MTQVPEPFTRLWSAMWTTKGARFKAHRRLTRLAAASNLTIAMLSVYAIAISVLQLTLAGSLDETVNRLLTGGIITASAFIIVLTLYENSKNHLIIADRMHRCALDLLELYNEFDATIRIAPQAVNLLDYSRRYNAILSKYPENHDLLDYLSFRCDNPKDFELKGWSLCWAHIQRLWGQAAQFSFYLVLALSVPAAVAWIYIR